jgi:hypothetical protein
VRNSWHSFEEKGMISYNPLSTSLPLVCQLARMCRRTFPTYSL